MLGDQRETVLFGCTPELFVPAGEGELLSSCEREQPGQVHSVVGAERMGASALGGVPQKCVGDGVTEDSTPDVLQILKGSIELGRRNALALSHPGQGCGGLDMSDGRGADAIRLGVGGPGLFGSGLVDQELDQRAGIEVEAQRRPSETYSAALLPEPWSLAGLVGR